MGRNTLLLGGLVMAALIASLATYWMGSGTRQSVAPLGPSAAEKAQPRPTAAGGSATSPASPSQAGPLEPQPAPEQAPAPPPITRLQVVAAGSLTPLEGISAYMAEERLGGPTGPDGWLELVPPSGRRTTFWAPGWSAREYRPGGLPAERVELTPADAQLEVLLDNLAPDEGALNSRLEPMDWTATEQTGWSAPLTISAPHRLIGEALAPGRYQLYVWIGAFRAQSVALEPTVVELEPGQRKLVRLDASAKPDEEVDS